MDLSSCLRWFCLYMFLRSVFMSIHVSVLCLALYCLYVYCSSDLSCKTHGFQTSTVESPRSMRASISQISDLRPVHRRHQESQDSAAWSQDVSTQQHRQQRLLNLRRPEISKKEEVLLSHPSKPKQDVLNVQEGVADPPQSRFTSEHHVRVNLPSSGYCKLSLYNTGASCQSDCGVATNSQDSCNFGNDSCSCTNTSQVDVCSKNVFGQPRVMATLRTVCTPRANRRSTVVEDLKKLIVMDDVTQKSPPDSAQPRGRADEHQGSASPKSLGYPSPVTCRRPPPHHAQLHPDPTECWTEFQNLSHEVRSPGDAQLDWSSLVNAAEEYELQMMENLLSLDPRDADSVMDPDVLSSAFSDSDLPHTDEEFFAAFPDHLSHLESMLRNLSMDLLKEKKNKVALLAEVLNLRVSNQHLKEESLSANAQLRKICRLFNVSPECTQ